jgi:hypothetical protein
MSHKERYVIHAVPHPGNANTQHREIFLRASSIITLERHGGLYGSH